MIDTLVNSHEYERQPNREIERKFLPLFPEKLEFMRDLAQPIEQLYLSHPDEPYSLRLRQSVCGDRLMYSAALKDNGVITYEGLDRMEVETDISQEVYEFYRSPEIPSVRKLRAQGPGSIVVDWFEDGHIQAESESTEEWRAFLDMYNLSSSFIEVTGDQQANSEWRAHYQYRLQHDGRETLVPQQAVSVDKICESILYRKGQPTVVRIMGRSGSGKSTLVRELQDHLQQYNISSVTISTDDYSKGKRFLDTHKGSPWSNWDDPFVYDTDQTAKDIDSLLRGETIARTRIDFTTQEPVIDGVIEPAQVIIVEGIYAKAPEIVGKAHLAYTVPTGLATSIGRRLQRDFGNGERITESMPTPEIALRHILEMTEPAYRA